VYDVRPPPGRWLVMMAAYVAFPFVLTAFGILVNEVLRR
jgi:hypothetical protein